MMSMCEPFVDIPGENMQILIGQLVNVMKDGKAVRMSKRAGNVVTIDDLTDAIGVDASRYSLARTDYNSPVDIDLNLLSSHSNENPVYYVQYAHARSCNVDRNAAAAGITYEGADVSLLDTTADGEVLAALAQWPALLREAGDLRAPHRVAHYLEDLAATYHKWYNVERVVPMELTDPEARGEQADAIRIARKTRAIVRQNVVFALAVKFACLVLVAIGAANMWAAIFADVGVMVLAVLNAIRALRVKNL